MRILSHSTAAGWRRPEILLLLMAAASPISFACWQTLLDNFAIHEAAFTGREIGILQSLREVPGCLAFAVVFVLLLVREQSLAYLSLAALGIGTALYGLLWLVSPALVFLSGAALATASLVLAILVPRDPLPGQEVWLAFRPTPAAGALPAHAAVHQHGRPA